MNYIASKVAKRMEGYKVRSIKDTPSKLLLSMSLGSSSVTLLHLLDRQLHTQIERTGRAGYQLHIIFVDLNSTPGNDVTPPHFISLQDKYPLHTYTQVQLEDVFTYDDGIANQRSRSATISRPSSGPVANFDRLRNLITSLPSPTSRSDVISILRTRLIVKFARHHGCDCVLWGDSTTRLAERTLSEAAKGRGLSLPWQTSDGLTPHGLTFRFPMRDILRKEILSYSQITVPPLTALVCPEIPLTVHSAASSKDITIDDVMSRYFVSAEQNYPSLVANVVRTTSKLEAPPSSTLLLCHLCNLPMSCEKQRLDAWSGTQERASNITKESDTARELCYGCARSGVDADFVI